MGQLQYLNGIAWVNVPTNGEVLIAKDQTSIRVRILTIDDSIVEGFEAFTVAATANGETKIGSATIADNDILTIKPISNVSLTEGDQALFTVELSNPSSTVTNVAVSLISDSATAVTDYSSMIESSFDGGTTWANVSGASVPVPVGVVSFRVRVQTIDDVIVESTELFSLAAAINGSTQTSTVSIADNDVYPTVSISAGINAAEPATNGSFILTRTGSTVAALTVNLGVATGTATSGSDYTALSTTATFLAGSATAIVNVNTIDDTVVESAETITLSIRSGSGYSLGVATSASISLTDNDVATINEINGTSDDETLTGTPGADIIYGNGGNDTMIGGGGNDTLIGGSGGNDTITANTFDGTNDTLKGVGEQDVLVGGAGSFNTFILGDISNSYYVGQGDGDYASIVNFNADYDTIQLSGMAENYNLINPVGGVGTAFLYRISAGGSQDLIAKITTSSLLDLNGNFAYVNSLNG